MRHLAGVIAAIGFAMHRLLTPVNERGLTTIGNIEHIESGSLRGIVVIKRVQIV